MILTAEDLLAISQMMDERLDRRLKPIESDIKTMKSDIKVIKNEQKIMKNDLRAVKDEVKTVRDEVKTVRAEVKTLKNELQRVKLFQENIIMPRLNEIEACYTSTYDRYKEHADRMERTYDDVAVLKQVVTGHSEKLQRAGIA